MSVRAPKGSRSKKTEQRNVLYALIEETGFEVMPCSFCEAKSLSCKMIDGVSRCSECVRRGRSCDGTGVSVSTGERLRVPFCFPVGLIGVAARLISEKRRLEKQEDETEAELLALQQQLVEKISKLTRLRRQKKKVISRGHAMVRRGFQSLDELEEAEREESEVVVDVQALGGFDVIDWNAVLNDSPSGSSLTPEEVLVTAGFAEGTA